MFLSRFNSNVSNLNLENSLKLMSVVLHLRNVIMYYFYLKFREKLEMLDTTDEALSINFTFENEPSEVKTNEKPKLSFMILEVIKNNLLKELGLENDEEGIELSKKIRESFEITKE